MSAASSNSRCLEPDARCASAPGRGPPACPGPSSDGRPWLRRQVGLQLDLVRDLHRVDEHRRDAVPVHGDPVADGLLVPLDAREDDLELGLGRERLDVALASASRGLRVAACLNGITSNGTPRILATSSVSLPSSPTS